MSYTDDALMPSVAPIPKDEPARSPLHLVAACETELESRRSLVDLLDDYANGRHQYTFVSDDYEKAFAQMLAAVCDNWMPLILQAKTERQHVQGFRVGDVQGDSDAWAIWQENNLDVDSDLVFWEAAKHGEAYTLTWPETRDAPGVFGRFLARRSERRARITPEHPGQMVVLREPGDRRRRAAAFKKWQDTDGMLMGSLWTPTHIFRFQRTADGQEAWGPRDASRLPPGASWYAEHDFGVVPVVPVVNLPSMLPSWASNAAKARGVDGYVGLGRSDILDVLGTQDELNKFVADLLIASEVGAFRQRWAIGIQPLTDPETNKPISPFKPGADQLWLTNGKKGDVEFGEFEATDLQNFTRAWDNRVQSLSARTRTPPHYLTGQIVNASGDALKAAETGLTFKVKHANRGFGEPLEEAIRLGFAVKGDKRASNPDMETLWEDPESISPSELVDSLVKKLALGVPPAQLWLEARYSPQQITEFKDVLQDEGQRRIAEAATGAVARERGATVPPEPAEPAAAA